MKDSSYCTLLYLDLLSRLCFFSFPECLVQQATFGSTPSTLILSYLNHGITTKVWYKNTTLYYCSWTLLNSLLIVSRPIPAFGKYSTIKICTMLHYTTPHHITSLLLYQLMLTCACLNCFFTVWLLLPGSLKQSWPIRLQGTNNEFQLKSFVNQSVFHPLEIGSNNFSWNSLFMPCNLICQSCLSDPGKYSSRTVKVLLDWH